MKKIRFAAVLMTAAMLAGCGQSGGEYKEGRLGDAMETYFFDFTVRSATLCDTFETYTPAEGNRILMVDVEVKNTGNASIEMYDTDFQAQWGGEGEDDYSVPITFDKETEEELDVLNENQLPATYTLGIDETRAGLLVFEVPGGEQDFSLSYQEYFDNDSTGDVYFVYFTPEENMAYNV